jgi:hypothetical protein
MDQLERECRSYTQYLTGHPPLPYVIGKYREFHGEPEQAAAWSLDPFDQFLVEFSARGSYHASLADTYASRFRSGSALRKKIVLTLAILECVPPSFEKLDAVDRGGWTVTIARLGLAAFRYAVRLSISAALFTPFRIACAINRKSRQPAVAEP